MFVSIDHLKNLLRKNPYFKTKLIYITQINSYNEFILNENIECSLLAHLKFLYYEIVLVIHFKHSDKHIHHLYKYK